MCLFSSAGYEGGAHMAEETHNAAASAPQGIILTCIITGLTGLLYICGLLYACNDQIDKYYDGISDYPVVNLFVTAFTTSEGVYHKFGAVTMTALLLVNIFFAGFSSMTVTSRIGFAMARDGAFPKSGFLYKVNSKTKAPARIIGLVFILDVLLCLLPLISTTAFEAITGISAVGYQISYAIPILCRLTVSKNTFKKSTFNLGWAAIPIGWISVVFLCITSVFFVLPFKLDDSHSITAENFNYTIAVLALIMFLALFYWYLPAPYGARHFFTGPKRIQDQDAEHLLLSEDNIAQKDT
jgi:amino acid transporter